MIPCKANKGKGFRVDNNADYTERETSVLYTALFERHDAPTTYINATTILGTECSA